MIGPSASTKVAYELRAACGEVFISDYFIGRGKGVETLWIAMGIYKLTSAV